MADTDHPLIDLCGAVYDPDATRAFQGAQPIKAYADVPSESGEGKSRFLWEFVRKVLGSDFHEIQTGPTCVSKGVQRGIVNEGCVQIAMRGFPEELPGVPATEPIYALARHEIGRDKLGRGGGAVVAYGIQAVMDFGVIIRGVYGKIDLSKPDDSLANLWGAPGHGCPDQIEEIAKQLPVKAAAPITSVIEARDAVYNGYYLVMGSNHIPGQNESRDSNGFLQLKGRGGHCTGIDGFNDLEEWFRYDNGSWPPVSGANPEGFPVYGGKITYRLFETMLNEGECYAISSVSGLPSRAEQLDFVMG